MRTTKTAFWAILTITLLVGWSAKAQYAAKPEPRPVACGLKIQAGLPEAFKCLDSSGNAALNAKAVSQVKHLNGIYQTKTLACFIDDGAEPNAWSWSGGKIFIGRGLIRKEFEEHGNMALLGVMAHEWAHQLQFREGVFATHPTVVMELQADCMAGFHLGMFANASAEDVGRFSKSLYMKGDYAFNDPTHHGTPLARVEMMGYGQRLGAAKKTKPKEAFLDCLGKALATAESDKEAPAPSLPAAKSPKS